MSFILNRCVADWRESGGRLAVLFCVCCGALDGPRDQFGLSLFIQFIELTRFTQFIHFIHCRSSFSVQSMNFTLFPVPNRCVGACRGSGCRPGVLVGVSSGAVDGLEG